jgi:hypothetical protein
MLDRIVKVIKPITYRYIAAAPHLVQVAGTKDVSEAAAAAAAVGIVEEAVAAKTVTADAQVV